MRLVRFWGVKLPRPRSALIEVGAQTNTCEEALNAMEPLSELLDLVLGGGGENSAD